MGAANLYDKRAFYSAIILVALTAIAVYAPTFDDPFHFDDRSYIEDNSGIRSLSDSMDLSGSRSVAFFTFALNYRFGGLDTFGYHVVNLLIHVVNGVLLWLFVMLTFRTRALEGFAPGRGAVTVIALAAALVFVAHPVQTQAVTYLTQRLASLATMFYLLSLVCYVSARMGGLGEERSEGRVRAGVAYVVSIVAAVAAMKTKEISFTLPFVIVLYEYAFIRARGGAWRAATYLAPYAVTLAVIPLAFFEAGLGADPAAGPDTMGDGGAVKAEMTAAEQLRDLRELSSHDYLMTQFPVIVTYLRLLIFPVRQNLDYDFPLYMSFFTPAVAASFVLLAAVFVIAAVALVRSRRRGNGLALVASFGVLWFFITISIESSVVPILDVIFEHRLYLPMAGAAIFFSVALFYLIGLMRADGPVRNFSIAAAVVVIVLAAAAYKRNGVWADEITLWQDVVTKSPAKARGHTHLGYAYMKAGRIDEAIKEYLLVVEINPAHYEGRNNLAMAYNRMGRNVEALEELKTAVAYRPDFAMAHANMGSVLSSMGRYGEAVSESLLALRFDPSFVEARVTIGAAYARTGRLAEAATELETVVRERPEFYKARNNLANVYAMLGRTDDAIVEYREALRLRPGDAGAHFNLGLAYKSIGMRGEARGEFEKVLDLYPGDAAALRMLGSL